MEMIIIFSVVLCCLSIITIVRIIPYFCPKFRKKKPKSSDGMVNTTTPVSLLEVNVTLPLKVISGDKIFEEKYDLPELAQIPKARLGEGTLGALFKVVLNSGSIVTIRKIREGMVNATDLELWINFFAKIRNPWLLSIEFSFWYGGEAFVLCEYLILGSLAELLHGSEGIQFSPLKRGIRKQIAWCAANAVASIHSRVTGNDEGLVCGVIKATNILIKTNFTACLSSHETPYSVSMQTIIRRNPSRVAPELRQTQNGPKMFTQKLDVYSFGMLLLELITGKRSSVVDLGEYILEKKKESGLNYIFDKRMGDMKKENVVGMLEIARLCLLRNPQDRPSMDKVVQMTESLHD